MRRYCLIFGLVVWAWLGAAARADEFHLTTGKTVIGDVLAASGNEQGVKIRVAEGEYETVYWPNFSQDDLKKLGENPKLAPLVEPFIEIPQQERAKRTEVTPKMPERLPRPAPQSFFGAMLSSGLGLVILLAVYAANIYAAFEVAVFRAQPPALVCGLAAVPLLGFLSPIVFLSMPTKLPPGGEGAEAEAAPGEPGAAPAPGTPAAAAAGADPLNPMAAEGAHAPTGLHLAHTAEAPKEAVTATTTYQRGQFTFNRRFFETKFPGFFSVVRRDADRDMVLVIKCARGEYVGDRIARIAANDLHLQVPKGRVTEEVLIPFGEIKEIRVQHKDAKP